MSMIRKATGVSNNNPNKKRFSKQQEVKDLVDETVLRIGSNTMAQENPYRFMERSVDDAEGNEHCSRTIGENCANEKNHSSQDARIRDVDQQLFYNQQGMTEIENNISNVEKEIGKVEEKIKEAEGAIFEESKRCNQTKEYWMKEKEQLRKKEEQLRKEKEQLRKKEEQLREEKKILLINLVHKQETQVAKFPAFQSKEQFDLHAWPAASLFEEIRSSTMIPYVDKTGLLPDLVSLKSVFISRPRRFGKSLLVSTIEDLFLGYSQLFEELSINKTCKWDWNKKYPVLKLDLSKCNINNFESSLLTRLREVASQYCISLNSCDQSFDGTFEHIVKSMKELNQKQGRFANYVVLIDEYDKPVIDCLDNVEVATRNAVTLKHLFQLIKSTSPFFSLITGSSRLARTSVFSGDNQRIDISYDSRFNELCGFTEEEVKSLLENVNIEGIQLEEMKKWYNGYYFGSTTGIYNPFAIASALVNTELKDYWVQSGTTNLLAQYCGSDAMKIFVQNLLQDPNGLEFSMKDIMSPEDFQNLGRSPNSLALLYLQAGYLTFYQENGSKSGYLRIPNDEVRNYALPKLIIRGVFKLKYFEADLIDPYPSFKEFIHAIYNKNLESLYDGCLLLFSAIGYPEHGNVSKYEDYYRSILQAFLLSHFKDTRVELRTSSGRCDILVNFVKWSLLIELKTIKGSNSEEKESLGKVLEAAFDQIKKYESLLPDVVCVFLIDTSTRTLFPRTSLPSLPYIVNTAN